MILRVLAPVTARELLAETGQAGPSWPPEPDSSAEREAAHAVTAALERRVTADVADCHRQAQPRQGAPRRMRWLTHLFR